MEYHLVRSRRKSIGLQIRRDATLVVRAPHFVSDRMIRDVIREKELWIQKTRARVLEHVSSQPCRRWTDGETLSYLGQDYLLELTARPCVLPTLTDRFCLSREYASHAPRLFERWYREQAEAYLPGRVSFYAQKLGKEFGAVKINGAAARWGSCSYRGDLNFSWRIMMAPPEVVDYVAAHEVAHLDQKNHSSRFWDVVARLCPDYARHRDWLHEHGERLKL